MRNAHKILVRRPEGKRPLGSLKHRWEDNITIELENISWKVVNWMHLAQDRDQRWVFVNTVMNLWVP
jgi:hypothetical protein